MGESRYEKLHEGASAALEAGRRQASAGLFSKMISGLALGRQEPLGKEIRQGVFNRSAGIVLGIKRSPSGPQDRIFRVLLTEGGEVEVDTAQLRDAVAEGSKAGIAFHHNFATTIYASQGQTVQRVLIMDSPFMNRRLAYVGMSRHKVECDVYADRQDLTARKRERAKRDLGFTWSRRGQESARAALAADSFPDGELWAEMALAWNKDAKNPTVTLAKRRMQEKRDRSAKEGSQTGRLRPAEGDDPDDHPEPRRQEPLAYEELARAAAVPKTAAPRAQGRLFRQADGRRPTGGGSRGPTAD